MGQSISVKNTKIEVEMQLKKQGFQLVLKVYSRQDKKQEKYLHFKRYFYRDLPVDVQNKFKTVKQFYQYLLKSQDKIKIKHKSLIVEIDGQFVEVIYQNVNQQSKIYCDMQSRDLQVQIQNRQNIINAATLNLILSLQSRQQTEMAPDRNQQADIRDCKCSLMRLITKMMNKNNNLHNENLKGLNLRSLVKILENQYQTLETNTLNASDMKKKKASQPNKQPNQQMEELKDFKNKSQIKSNDFILQIQALKNQLKSQTQKIAAQAQQIVADKDQIKTLNIKLEAAEKFCSADKILSIAQEVRHTTKEEVVEQFLKEISQTFNRSRNKSQSITKSGVQIQIVNKKSLLHHIENLLKELQNLRSQKKTIVELKDEILALKDRIQCLETQNQKKIKDASSFFACQYEQQNNESLNSSDAQAIQRKANF